MAMKKALNFSTFHAEKWEKKQDMKGGLPTLVDPYPVYGQSIETFNNYAKNQNPSVKVGAYGANGDVFYVCCDVCDTNAELNITHPVTHIDDYCKFHVHVIKNETISGLGFLTSGKVPALYQAYANKESNSNVVLTAVPALVDPMGPLNVSLGCKVCLSVVYYTENSIQQSYPGSSNCFIDAIKDFCGKHRHEEQKEQKEQTLEEKVSIASNGSVQTTHYKTSYPSIDEYYTTCTYCKQQSRWLEASNLEQCALGFAKAHRHTVPSRIFSSSSLGKTKRLRRPTPCC